MGYIPDEIPEYPKGEVVNSAGDEREYIILVDNTNQEDLNEYLQTLEENGWYTSLSDYARKNNITLYFQFNAENLLQLTVYVEKLGTWPTDKLPIDIVPPEKGVLLGEVGIVDNSSKTEAYYITIEYSGLSNDDVREYMEAYLDRGWEGDEYYIKSTIEWKGKQFIVDMEPYYDAGIASFAFNLMEQ